MLKRLRNLLQRKGKTDVSDAARTERSLEPAPLAARAEAPAVHHGPNVVHRPIPQQELDPEAVKILRRLTRFDHTAYLVGGCVRDLLLERRPKDFDIGTSATPRTVKRLFSNCRIIGRRFRLAHIYFPDGKFIEVATFRARDVRDPDDGVDAQADDRDLLIRDDNVFGTPEEDALRRDFTINQLFYDIENGNVLDHADGLGDLRRRLVRTIGDPEIRFREDPIRILRAVKFAARLDFRIEPGTLEGLRRSRSELPKAAPPRVLEEIHRFCRGGAARRTFELLFETGVFEVILPELAPVYRDAEARRLLDALLDRMDARAAGSEVSSGEIFAALALPALTETLGWLPGGAVRTEGRPDPRLAADAVLRPIALRLRIARRDQERFRQAIATLQRLVPEGSLRRGARTALSRRPAFADALALLEAAAALWGGELARSFESWRSRAPEPAAAPDARGGRRPQAAAPDAEEPAREEHGRRRKRRGRRRRGGAAGAEAIAATQAPTASAATPPSTAPSASAKKLPPKWSDDYFFAALPSVPEDLRLGEDAGDRYGALAAAPSGLSDAAEIAADDGAGPALPGEPRRRRRRRRGRRGGRRGPGGAVGEGEESGPAD